LSKKYQLKFVNYRLKQSQKIITLSELQLITIITPYKNKWHTREDNSSLGVKKSTIGVSHLNGGSLCHHLQGKYKKYDTLVFRDRSTA